MASGFLEKLLSLFGNSNEPEAAKKRHIKQLAKELSRNKYSKFYRVKSGEIDGSMGKIFYDMYKVVSPAKSFLQNAAKSAQLKQIVVETFFDNELQEVRDRLTPEAVEEKIQSGNVNIKELGKSLGSDLTVLSSALDSGMIASIDRCYNNILAMIQFVSFDFFFFLKKFDSKITDRNFTYQPIFAPVRGEYLKNELKDFLEASFGVDPDQDWKKALAAIRTYKNDIDVVKADQWNKLLLLLRDIKKSEIIELMIRHIEQKPDWFFKSKLIDEHITEGYLENKRAEIKAAVDKVLKARKTAQADALARAVFGSTEINRVKYYTEKNSEIYIKKNFDGFLYSSAINYLKAFLLDYLKKDLRELFDLVLVRGQWADKELANHTSDYFHKLMDASDKLIAFDESLGDTGENGGRLKSSIVKADRDKSQARYVTLILQTVNEQAMEMIKASALSLIAIAKSLKILSDDFQKTSHPLVINWKELESVSEVPLAQRIGDAYKKVYCFVQLMQTYIGPGEKEA